MVNVKVLDRRRKSVRNIRKITRTMELISTAQFKRAMDRSMAINAYTLRLVNLVEHLTQVGVEVTHPLLRDRDEVKQAALLVLSSNRGLCGGYNSSLLRLAIPRWKEISHELGDGAMLEVSGKRGINACKFRGIVVSTTYTQFEDKPSFDEVNALATRYLEDYLSGRLDRLEIVYTRFISLSRQRAVREVLLPLTQLTSKDTIPLDAPMLSTRDDGSQMTDAEMKKAAMIKSAQEKFAKSSRKSDGVAGNEIPFEFYPSAESIMDEAITTAFRVKFFKCFLDAAVNEQIARMVAMKAATDNATKMIGELSRKYNRARQSKITGELLEIVGGADAVN
ncbi:MAG: ATP synthase F1 subunit gamma [Thermoguttaceae bacterium]